MNFDVGKAMRLWTRRRKNYRDVFIGEHGDLTPAAKEVIADLKKFCRANESTFVKGDPHASALLEGRREVWNRIANYLYLKEEEVRNLKENKKDI
jgi:hypothetical protein